MSVCEGVKSPVFTLASESCYMFLLYCHFHVRFRRCYDLISAASALLQSSLFGLVARFPQQYTQAIMGGMVSL